MTELDEVYKLLRDLTWSVDEILQRQNRMQEQINELKARPMPAPLTVGPLYPPEGPVYAPMYEPSRTVPRMPHYGVPERHYAMPENPCGMTAVGNSNPENT